MIRPVGNGVTPAQPGCCPSCWVMERPGQAISYRTLRDGPLHSTFQAFHAWLPSSGPSGTNTPFSFSLHTQEALATLRNAYGRMLVSLTRVELTYLIHEPTTACSSSPQTTAKMAPNRVGNCSDRLPPRSRIDLVWT